MLQHDELLPGDLNVLNHLRSNRGGLVKRPQSFYSMNLSREVENSLPPLSGSSPACSRPFCLSLSYLKDDYEI